MRGGGVEILSTLWYRRIKPPSMSPLIPIMEQNECKDIPVPILRHKFFFRCMEMCTSTFILFHTSTFILFHTSTYVLFHTSTFILFHAGTFILFHTSTFILFQTSTFILFHTSTFILFHSSTFFYFICRTYKFQRDRGPYHGPY